jgi:hypothetical protein
MSSIRVSGNTSGYYDLTVPDVAGQNTIPLDRVVTTDSNGSITLSSTTSSPSLQIERNDGSGNVAQAGFNVFGSSTNIQPRLAVGVGPAGSPPNADFFFTEDGKMGIGTSNPNKELTINGNAHVGRNSSSIPNTSLASNLDFLQVGASTFIQAGADAQAFIKSNNYWNGSGTSYVNTSYGSTTVRLNENNDGKFQIETASNSGAAPVPRLIINNTGAVTKPNQPHWFGTNNNSYTADSSTWITHGSGNNGGAGTGILKFNSAYSSSGSEWNGQRYTATVAGLYYFDLTLDILNGSNIVFRGLKNGGRFHDEERVANLGSGWWNYNYSGHVYLNVNDYFEVSFSNGTWGNIAGGVWSKFGIRLVL